MIQNLLWFLGIIAVVGIISWVVLELLKKSSLDDTVKGMLRVVVIAAILITIILAFLHFVGVRLW